MIRLNFALIFFDFGIIQRSIKSCNSLSIEMRKILGLEIFFFSHFIFSLSFPDHNQRI